MTEPSDLPDAESSDGPAQIAGGEGFTAALGASLTQLLQFLDRANAACCAAGVVRRRSIGPAVSDGPATRVQQLPAR